MGLLHYATKRTLPLQADMLTTIGSLIYWALTLYEWIIILAILVSWVNPDPSNTLVRFLNRMTMPLWNWLGQYLPGPLRLFSAYMSLLLVWFLRIFLPGCFTALAAYMADQIGAGDLPVRFAGYFILGAGVVTKNMLFFIMVLMLVWFFMTLLNPSVNNPIVRTVYFLVDPFITPVQKRIPRGRIDISPLIVAGAFLLVNILVVDWLIRFAVELALGSPGQLPTRSL